MDPCPFARLIVESLALKLPTNRRSPVTNSGVHPSTNPCYCKLTLKNFPSQTTPLPLFSGENGSPDFTTSAAGFHLDATSLRRISQSSSQSVLKLSVNAGKMVPVSCGIAGTDKKVIGTVEVKMDLKDADTKPMVFHNGWITLAGERKEKAWIHLVVRSEPDPRFTFQFGGEPECSPVVFQVQGNSGIRQPVFSCKFTADRNNRTRSLPTGFELKRKGWLRRTISGDRESRSSRDRKGWMVMIYDLSGSAVAAASIITPFVPSPGSHRVSRSNPGAWLILRPSHHPTTTVDSWKPWGRLEAWRAQDGFGYQFELVDDNAPGRNTIAEGVINGKTGGEFRIDGGSHRGFVMCSTVEAEGKESRPTVMVGAKHVTCTADAALFVALSAAVDLSMDACRLFSRRLRKELCSSSSSDSINH